MEIKTTIGRNIRILRKEKGMTLQSLSKQIGISHQQLSRIENGLGTSTSTLERIAAVLEVDMKILMDEPEVTLKRSISSTRNFVTNQFCNQLYAKIFSDVIKPVNDATIERFINEIFEYIVKDKKKIRNIMCEHVGSKNSYQFTVSELEDFCQQMFFEFTAHALSLSKVDYNNEEQTEWSDLNA